MTNDLEQVETLKIPVESVIPDPDQPRKTFIAKQDDELAHSIEMNGQLVPILVYWNGSKWVIVDGERRWRAAKALNMLTIDSKILPAKPSESQLLIMQLTANCQRSDLHPLDRLDAFKHLLSLTSWKATELASHLCLSKPTVSRILSLDRFNEDEKLAFRNGNISTSEAYALARLSDADRSEKFDAICHVQESSNVHASQSTSTKSLNLQLGSNAVRLTGDACENFDAMLLLLKNLTRECKKAQREGIDPKTFARVLGDKSQTVMQESK